MTITAALIAAEPKPSLRFITFGEALFANLAVSMAPIKVKIIHKARIK